MNALDVILLALLVTEVLRGAQIGFSRQFFSFVGFWGGLLLAALLAPQLSGLAGTAGGKILVILTCVLLISVTLSLVGERIGLKVAMLVTRIKASTIDAGLGGVFGGVLVCLSVWILAGMLLNVHEGGIGQQVQQSRIVRAIDSVLPPAPAFIAKIQRLIEPNGFPQVFVGPEPQPGESAGVATQAELNAATAAARPSVVQIEGVGCGGEVFGSGFVSSPGVVVTNAHVVAGIRRPLVRDRSGVHAAATIWFNPNKDLAVLRVSGLNDPPLVMRAPTVPNGTHAVVMGFPGGGPFRASAAGVIQSYVATGRNIYDQGLTARRVYELEAGIQPGNSGGPLVNVRGEVIGVIFAKSQLNDSVGYALTMSEALPDIQQAQSRRQTVSTGQCAAD